MRWNQVSSRKRGQLIAHVLAGSDVCALCGHDQADTADHITPVAHGGQHVLDNLRPAHQRPCPTCGVRCNQVRGAGRGRVVAPPARPVWRGVL